MVRAACDVHGNAMLKCKPASLYGAIGNHPFALDQFIGQGKAYFSHFTGLQLQGSQFLIVVAIMCSQNLVIIRK